MTNVKAQISNQCQMTNAKKYVLRFKVPWFTPALPVPRPGRDREARLDMHSWNDRTELYARSFYATGEESQVWARGSRLTDGNWNNPEPSYATPQGCSLFFDQTGRFGGQRRRWTVNLTTLVVTDKWLIILEKILTLGFWIWFDIWILSFEFYSIGHHKSLSNTHSRVGAIPLLRDCLRD